ncbi:flap endonuclease 1-like protein [Dinothrombium tinctorium]|uniref:Flap endonuclease 1 n=1 Tax=Dinothrombium tinctorium TaxID=1965070 RepID=A0A3S3SPM2_9ACAR|nr:flap endonuclease 1-like protein [Dinothrombium tinctorium]RWS17158.1 flap endonuclease 1-like protein [Dinothrombium tinctorium]
MGILGLSRLIADVCPEAIKEVEISSFFGRRVAIDASMSIYQFLIAIRNNYEVMTNSEGETTSHLVGLFYRTCKLLECGIKPIYVFDGKAPQLKADELAKRKERRDEASKKLEEAETAEDIGKFSKRLVRVTRQHNEDCKKLLTLMGLPIICAPSEAEAQCAQLCKEGLVYAVATEDMDGLTFGAPKLIRNLSAGGSAENCKEYTLSKVLQGLELDQSQFIDLCILMGCDYCNSIKGVGGKKGLELIKKYGSIEKILKEKFNVTEFIDADISYEERKRNLENDSENGDMGDVKNEEHSENGSQSIEEDEVERKSEMTTQDKNMNENDEEEDSNEVGNEVEEKEEAKEANVGAKKTAGKSKKKSSNQGVVVPENWLFKGARKLFIEPSVIKGEIKDSDLKIKEVDEEGLIEFLCKQHGFNEDRIRSAIKRIKAAKGKSNQTRIDTFFAAKPVTNSQPKPSTNKRSSNGKVSSSKRGRRPK